MLKNCEIVKHCRYKCLQHRVSRLFHNFSLGDKNYELSSQTKSETGKKSNKTVLEKFAKTFSSRSKKIGVSISVFRFFQTVLSFYLEPPDPT